MEIGFVLINKNSHAASLYCEKWKPEPKHLARCSGKDLNKFLKHKTTEFALYKAENCLLERFLENDKVPLYPFFHNFFLYLRF